MSNSGWPTGKVKNDKVIMTPLRQKQIVDEIKSLGFVINQFDFLPKSNEWFRVNYKMNNSFYFDFNEWDYLYSPGDAGKMFIKGRNTSWEGGKNQFRAWLVFLKENVVIGNPWEEIEEIKEKINSVNFDSYDEMFSDSDRKAIDAKLTKMLDYFEGLKIDTTEIKSGISHLNEMSDRISKKDWFLLFLGHITGWIFQGIVSPENTMLMWEFISNTFSGFSLPFIIEK